MSDMRAGKLQVYFRMQLLVRDTYYRVQLPKQASWPNKCVCICAAQIAQGLEKRSNNLEFPSHAELIIREGCIMHVTNQAAVKSSKAISYKNLQKDVRSLRYCTSNSDLMA